MTNTELIQSKYHGFRNYHSSRLNEQWELDVNEWITYFTDGEGKGVLERRCGTSFIGRINAEEAWSIANIKIHDKPIRISRNQPRTNNKIEANDNTEKPVKKRVIKLSQWIAELRKDAEKA